MTAPTQVPLFDWLVQTCCVIVILAVQFDLLRQIPVTGFLGMLLLVVAFTSAGWALGGTGAD